MYIYLLVDNRFPWRSYYGFKNLKTAKLRKALLGIKRSKIERIWVDQCPTDGMYTPKSHYCAECSGGE